MSDCVIIGTGVAGISAALTLKLLKRSFILIGDKALSHKIGRAEKIKNYPGLASVTGEELKSALLSQLAGEGIDIVEERVNGVYPAEVGYSVTCGQKVYEARTVILACGTETVKSVEGELEFLGRGVSYCATCDGFLYRGKTIVAAVESEEELAEVELLKSYASKVYVLGLKKGIEGTEGVLKGIIGDMRVKAVESDKGVIEVDGVFVLKRGAAAQTLVHGLKTEGGAVVVDRAQGTNLPGVFAAGDVTGRPYQYAKAAGEGNVAAHSVNNYLNNK